MLSIRHLFCSTVFLITGVFSFAQNKNELSVEFNANQAGYSMDSLNVYFQDTLNFYNTDKFYIGRLAEKRIEDGFNFNININYQAFEAIGFGVYADVNNSSMTFPLEVSFESMPDQFYEGKTEMSVSALSFGASIQLNVFKLLKIDINRKGYLEHVDLFTRFMGGHSLVRYDEHLSFLGTTLNSKQYASKNFQGKAELGLGYRFGNSFFTTVGLKMGYQFLKTKDVRNSYGTQLEVYDVDTFRSVPLNFNGLYYGVYLTFGK